MSNLLIDAVVVEVGSGLLVFPEDAGWRGRDNSTFYLVQLPTPKTQRAWALAQWRGMSREDRSTQARVNGQEVQL